MGQTVVMFGRERRGVGVTASECGLFHELDMYMHQVRGWNTCLQPSLSAKQVSATKVKTPNESVA